jgi:tripartite-type tricarboxylate transporter receptor subunit TctC
MTGALRAPAVAHKLAADGADVVGNAPEEFARVLRAEIEKWSKVARAAGIEPS